MTAHLNDRLPWSMLMGAPGTVCERSELPSGCDTLQGARMCGGLPTAAALAERQSHMYMAVPRAAKVRSPVHPRGSGRVSCSALHDPAGPHKLDVALASTHQHPVARTPSLTFKCGRLRHNKLDPVPELVARFSHPSVHLHPPWPAMVKEVSDCCLQLPETLML